MSASSCTAARDGAGDRTSEMGRPQRRASTPATIVNHARYAVQFESVADFAKSYSIVVATITDEQRQEPYGPEYARNINRTLSVNVEEILAGPSPAPASFVDWGWVVTADGEHPVVAEGGVRLKVGDRAVLILSRFGEKIELVNDQAVFLLSDGNVIDTDRHDPLVRQLEQLTERELKDEIRRRVRS
ncbi:MAG: hypothetical protein ABR520_01505 [Mycobacteriales bacterium]|nr:hypothetical protein [Frankia sp.]